MEPERWRRIEKVFQAALDSEPSRRDSLLDEACAGDPSLRNEVESLLASHDRGGFTEAPAFADGLRVLEKNQSDALTGRRIGRYQVIREIGRGGMGAVHLAARADEAFRKEVAIKLIKRGLDTGSVIQRFRNERQILASLDHPNITRLLDGGTTEDGLPYFVMEYIQGEPIDKYCEARRLNTTERLKLFQSVCAAVHYAHQNLIIHRDIKPGNVLVTAEGVPRLLDFGIAKLLQPGLGSGATTDTMTAARLMTPEYASPEQVRGETITTASDVYSLGVLLYRLLTGHRPYRLAGRLPDEMERAICEEDPEKPSTVIDRREEFDAEGEITPQSVSETREGSPEKLRRRLRGDLDNIALKALRKEPQRRYTSAEQFSEDIRRHLEGLPVKAHADSWNYRAGKFVRRHRAGVVAAVLIVLSLVSGVVATAWQARVARRERARAESQFNDVRKLSTSFLFEFHDAIRNLPGATPARQLLVQRALEYLSKLAEEARGDRRLQRELAEAYMKVGNVQGNPYAANLGDAEGAAKSYDKALQISKALAQSDSTDPETRRCLARSYKSLGEVLPVLGRPGEAVKNFREAAAILESLTATDQDNAALRQELANSYQELGDVQGHSGLQNVGDPAGALESYRKALTLYETLAPQSAESRRGAALLQMRIGDLQASRDDLDGERQAYYSAMDIWQGLSAADPTNAEDLRRLAHAYRKVGGLQEDLQNFKEALKYYGKASSINEGLMNADPANAQATMSYAISLRWSGDLLNKLGDRRGALAKHRSVLQLLEKLYAGQRENVLVRGRLSDILIVIGGLLARAGESKEAHRLTSRGLLIARELAALPDVPPDDLGEFALHFLTCQPSDLREPATALQFAKKAVAKSGGTDSDGLDILAQAYFQNGEVTRAIETEERALKLLAPPRPNQPEPPKRRRIMSQLAKFKAAQPQ